MRALVLAGISGVVAMMSGCAREPATPSVELTSANVSTTQMCERPVLLTSVPKGEDGQADIQLANVFNHGTWVLFPRERVNVEHAHRVTHLDGRLLGGGAVAIFKIQDAYSGVYLPAGAKVTLRGVTVGKTQSVLVTDSLRLDRVPLEAKLPEAAMNYAEREAAFFGAGTPWGAELAQGEHEISVGHVCVSGLPQ